MPPRVVKRVGGDRGAWPLVMCCMSCLASASEVQPAGVEGTWAAVLLSTPGGMLKVPVKSWKAIRDRDVVKQDKDFSCGAAALATLLAACGQGHVTEKMLLEAMDKGDMRGSFEDMARALADFGFRAHGFAASWEQLTRLRLPVVVYLRHRKDDHFSVLRGIGADTVWLADPSLGNRTYSKAQFLEMWETRQGLPHQDLPGKFLAVLPAGRQTQWPADYFVREPARSSLPAVRLLAAGRPF